MSNGNWKGHVLFPEQKLRDALNLRTKPDDAVSAPETRAQADAPKIRKRLKQFIKEKAKIKKPEEYKKDDFLADARNESNMENLSRNMFNEIWREAIVPKGFKLPGRRPGRR